MKILVTGSSGLLGSHLSPVLAASHQVFALVRSALSREKVRDLDAQPVDGDLENSTPLSVNVDDGSAVLDKIRISNLQRQIGRNIMFIVIAPQVVPR